MRKLFLILLLFPLLCAAQVYNAAYVKALYAKYPIVKSSFCADCYLWVNPYYKSIANLKEHRPLVEYELYTKANATLSDKLNIPREAPKKGAVIKPGQMKYQSAFSDWSSVTGQPSEDGVYKAANVSVKKIDKKDEIDKGHVQCWILNSFCVDAVILSDTYTFGAGPEDKYQNIGTEIFTENHTRDLLKTTDVQVWGGTFDDVRHPNIPHSFTDGKITDVYPTYYWKVIKYGNTTECWLMPNNKSGTQATIKSCIVTYPALVKVLGFDPESVLK